MHRHPDQPRVGLNSKALPYIGYIAVFCTDRTRNGIPGSYREAFGNVASGRS